MDVNMLNNKIVIIKDEVKSELVKLISLSSDFLNVKIITLSELKKKYFFDYTREARVFIKDKYNVINEVAEIYLENLYYIKDIDNEKINFLKEVKEELDNNNLLIYNKLFKEYLKGKDIILWNLEDVDKFYENIFEELKIHSNVEVYNDEKSFSKAMIYEAKTKEDEIFFVAEEISKLLEKGVNINNIKIANICISVGNPGNGQQQSGSLKTSKIELNKLLALRIKAYLDCFLKPVKYNLIKVYNDSCPIDLVKFQENNDISVTKCHHGFHYNCIKKYLYENENNKEIKCPVCLSPLFTLDDKFS